MRDEPLRTLLRLRRLALDEARLTLATSLAAETEAADLCRSIEEAIRRETDVASRVDAGGVLGGPATVEAFALWLRQTLTEQAAASVALTEAEGRTHEARIVLTVARSAVEAVETEIERREGVRRQEGERREQRSLDEISAHAPR